MAYFAVDYTYVDDAAALDRVRPSHRAHLAELAAQGLLVASGPLTGSPARALLIFQADSVQQVEQALAQDPFRLQGLIAADQISGWNPVIGIFADQL